MCQKLYLFVIFCLLVTKTFSQANNSKLTDFPILIVLKVKNISNDIQLKNESELKLAQYFLEQDRKANELFKSGESVQRISELYDINKTILSNILDDIELNNFILNDKDIPSEKKIIRSVIKLHNDLNLSRKQVQSLLDYCSKLDSQSNSIVNEYNIIENILDTRQYKNYYRLLNRTAAAKNSIVLLNELIKNKFLPINDSVKIYNIIYDYELDKLSGEKFISNSKEKGGDEWQFVEEPILLKRLRGIKSIPWWLISREIVDNRELFSITDIQLDSILSISQKVIGKTKEARTSDWGRDFKRKNFEYNLILKVLNKDQFNNYLAFSCKKRAEFEIQKYIERLENYNLLTNKNRKEIFDQLFRYELNVQISNEWVEIDRSKENLFKRLSLIESKPLIIIELQKKDNEAIDKKIVKF